MNVTSVQPEGTLVDKTLRKKILKKFPYGLFVIAAATRQKSAAIIANWVTQVSFEPSLLAIAIESDSEMRHLIEEAQLFSLNLLPAGSGKLVRGYLRSFRENTSVVSDKEFLSSASGIPILKPATDVFECKVVNSSTTGDHVLFIAEIFNAISNSNRAILTLAESGLHYSK